MKSRLFKMMLALGCTATIGITAMEAQAYYRSYHGGRYYNHHNYYYSGSRPYYSGYRHNYYYSGRPVYYRSYYYKAPRCGYWRYGHWYATRCY